MSLAEGSGRCWRGSEGRQLRKFDLLGDFWPMDASRKTGALGPGDAQTMHVPHPMVFFLAQFSRDGISELAL